MAWQDLFYFGKGERTALIILLCMIVGGGILLVVNRPTDKTQDAVVEAPTDTTTSVAPTAQANTPPATPKESVPERFKRLTTTDRNTSSYTRTEKFTAGTVLELNGADSLTLQKVPGIGPAFARRIVRYRELLGGFFTVAQLGEVYGIDEDKYNEIAPWFKVDASLINKLNVNSLPQDSLSRHPYINYSQARAIERLRRQKKQLTGWENLQLLKEFSEQDKTRIEPYLSFE
ncbi:MAG: helix-hairpin-helix domain-containing protein [Tannerella sp.]|jgi:DNA uptake protein ComE-like DNA-binding protein|nr:helix-hairpin-helix domain-containing protein [Tannerella sp.]